MAATWPKRIGFAAFALAIAGATVWALSPKPVPVDLAAVDTGPLEVTIEEEGVTRIRDVYQVFAPIGGFDGPFQVHLASAHFKQFDADVADLVTDKQVACYSRSYPA